MSLFHSDLGCDKIREIINRENAHVHLVGILGAGMLPLAGLLVKMGVRVSGRDRNEGNIGTVLPCGASIAPITEENIPSLLVYSLAIPRDDAELVLAEQMGIPKVSRAELLGALMLDSRRRVGISGAHGKSTVTALTDILLSRCGIPHTTVSGAPLATGESLSVSGIDTFVYEACEYKDSFLRTLPTVAVITNIELDHVDYFKDEEAVYTSFERFAASASELVIVGECEYSPRLATAFPNKVYVYGESCKCDFWYDDVTFGDAGEDFSLYFRGELLGRFHLSLQGEHNVKNAMAALSYAFLSGIPLDVAGDAIKDFRGAGRRLELLGYIGGRPIYYDYAHHPTEIKCTARTLNRLHGSAGCIFRPHTYTRTAALFEEFVESLSLFESSVLIDIYPAREDPIDGITSWALASSIGSKAVYSSFSRALECALSKDVGATVLMGAGEVDEIYKEIMGKIEKSK